MLGVLFNATSRKVTKYMFFERPATPEIPTTSSIPNLKLISTSLCRTRFMVMIALVAFKVHTLATTSIS